MIAAALSLLWARPATWISASHLLADAHRIPKALFYAAERASGTMFCDRRLRAAQARAFDAHYGWRFNRLVEVIRAREGLGWEAQDVIVTPCYLMKPRDARAELDRFELELRRIEQRYGL